MTVTIFQVCYVALFLVLCIAVKEVDKPQCSSARSCGDFHNIKCPFTLEGFPHNCSFPWKQLTCEKNQTIMHVSSKKFYVTDISHIRRTIRVVDPGLQKENCSSIPWNSMTEDKFDNLTLESTTKAVSFLNCLTRIVDSPHYVDASPCIKTSSNMNIYVVVEPAQVLDLKHSCSVFGMSWTSSKKERFSSYSQVHHEMMKGFELEWWRWLHPECQIEKPAPYALRRISYLIFYLLGWLYAGFFYMAGGLPHLKHMHVYIGPFLAGRFVLGTICVVAVLIYMVRRRHRALDWGTEEFLYKYRNQMPLRYSYMDIKRMTKDFKEELGRGGFGSVYKGFLRNNRPVAVKILGTSKSNGQEFINEVATIRRIHHVNVVQLIGFVAERSKRALIYEFMPNGSLEKYIFPKEGKSNFLSWEKTYEIALGIARGIEYLHRGCDMRILHFDIKPHNILLDEKFNPKVSDFGLARSYSMDDSIVSLTAIRGTLGYIAPELFYKSIGGISYKSDVYSFGMLLMEMAGRRKNVNALAENSSQIYIPLMVYNRLDQGDEIIEMENATEEEKEIAKKMIVVALWCIQMKPIDRPSMTKVVEMLEGKLDLLQMPPKPFFTLDHDEHANCISSTATTGISSWTA